MGRWAAYLRAGSSQMVAEVIPSRAERALDVDLVARTASVDLSACRVKAAGGW